MVWDTIGVRKAAKEKVREMAGVLGEGDDPAALSDVTETAIDEMYREVIGDPDEPIVQPIPTDLARRDGEERTEPRAKGVTYRL